MQWEKKGLIFCPNKENEWMDNSFLQPTPVVLDDKIRMFGGMRDKNGVSRVGYVDIDKGNPSNILGFSKTPVLDIGRDGMFDENGVTPTCVITYENKLYLYYAGYALGQKVRFQVFTGLAVSDDGGNSFKRVLEYPVTDRVSGEELFRVVHSAIFHNGIYKFWYGGGNHFVNGKEKTLPVYDIRYMYSHSPFSFPSHGITAITIDEGDHRVGRPFVFLEDDQFKMFYGYGSEAIPYQLAYAESYDGINWVKKNVGIQLSSVGWDSQMMAYPCYVKVGKKAYLFYNGNNYGRDGFGYAELKGSDD